MAERVDLGSPVEEETHQWVVEDTCLVVGFDVDEGLAPCLGAHPLELAPCLASLLLVELVGLDQPPDQRNVVVGGMLESNSSAVAESMMGAGEQTHPTQSCLGEHRIPDKTCCLRGFRRRTNCSSFFSLSTFTGYHS